MENMQARIVTTDIIETDAGFRRKSPNQSVSISPNPLQDFVSLQIESQHTTDLDIRLLDMSGRLVQQYQHSITNGVQQLNLPMDNQLDNGMYFLVIDGPDFDPTTKKIIKTH